MIFEICFGKQIFTGIDLRSEILNNNCCPYSVNYDPCCVITLNNFKYVGDKVRNFYLESDCCGEDSSCSVDLSECSDCNTFSQSCSQRLVRNQYGLINYNASTIEIRYSDRLLSGFQFSYDTDHTVDMTAVVSASDIFAVRHDLANKLVIGIFNTPQTNFSLFIQPISYGTYFTVFNEVLSDHRIPAMEI